jgi:hypothetical protein
MHCLLGTLLALLVVAKSTPRYGQRVRPSGMSYSFTASVAYETATEHPPEFSART